MPKPRRTLPVTDLDEPAEPITCVTIDQVTAICWEVATAKPTDAVGYQPTFPQVFFFTLVRAWKEVKKKMQAEKDAQVKLGRRTDPLPLLDRATVRNIAAIVARHLADWGAVVDGLQQRDAQEWELLRIQMEGSTKRFVCPQEMKDEALSDALLKVFQVLGALPTGEYLQTTQDTFDFFFRAACKVDWSLRFS